MSFHPLMPYGTPEFHRSERAVLPTGEPFAFTPERAARLEDICAKYPPECRKSAVLAALYLVQEQQGYITANGARAVAPFAAALLQIALGGYEPVFWLLAGALVVAGLGLLVAPGRVRAE